MTNELFSYYDATIDTLPVLTVENEKLLFDKYINHGCLQSAKTIVESCIRYVRSVAVKYKSYGIPLEDLIQEGAIALMNAVKTFDPNMGYRFLSYAHIKIEYNIKIYILRNWNIVCITETKNNKILFYKLKSTLTQIQQEEGYFGLNAKILEKAELKLGIDKHSICDFTVRQGGNISTHETLYDDRFSYGEILSNGLTLEDEILHNEERFIYNEVIKQIENLDERSKDILISRYVNEPKMSLQQLANKYGVSCEAIRQAEVRAINKLKSHLEYVYE